MSGMDPDRDEDVRATVLAWAREDARENLELDVADVLYRAYQYLDFIEGNDDFLTDEEIDEALLEAELEAQLNLFEDNV